MFFGSACAYGGDDADEVHGVAIGDWNRLRADGVNVSFKAHLVKLQVPLNHLARDFLLQQLALQVRGLATQRERLRHLFRRDGYRLRGVEVRERVLRFLHLSAGLITAAATGARAD
jgi:hypothetical protein